MKRRESIFGVTSDHRMECYGVDDAVARVRFVEQACRK